MRKALALALALTALSAQGLAQESGANMPVLEVVSIKANRSGAAQQSMRLQPGGRAVITNAPLRPLILTAYALLPRQLAGGPG